MYTLESTIVASYVYSTWGGENVLNLLLKIAIFWWFLKLKEEGA